MHPDSAIPNRARVQINTINGETVSVLKNGEWKDLEIDWDQFTVGSFLEAHSTLSSIGINANVVEIWCAETKQYVDLFRFFHG